MNCEMVVANLHVFVQVINNYNNSETSLMPQIMLL